MISKGIEQTLIENKALWHKSCREKFSNAKLERAKKRKLSEIDGDNTIYSNIHDSEGSCSPIKPRRSSVVNSSSSSQSQLYCFFCEQPDSVTNLHAASTLKVDKNVRDCAHLLQDTKLIAKLSSGDLVAIG